MNVVRLALGGAAAGAIINVCDYFINNAVLARSWQQIAQRHNLDEEAMGSMDALVTFVAIDFLIGFLLIWTYVAIRPRFGAGPGTAVKAVGAIWGAVVLATSLFGGWFVPWDLVFKSSGLALVAYLAGGMAGAALYKESSA